MAPASRHSPSFLPAAARMRGDAVQPRAKVTRKKERPTPIPWMKPRAEAILAACRPPLKTARARITLAIRGNRPSERGVNIRSTPATSARKIPVNRENNRPVRIARGKLTPPSPSSTYPYA
ncbi:S-adenosylmethionine synthetase [Moorella thermoacetica Y72]|uniref:S-adenosylmethionine synthetase n=1 Tax=Moorella thermoacetica Y72 TaxID=1325331 RepID=A0A0S6UEH5_NEOTH|nr:S-adenosylmethionine synthetase [Moorella thermoacetica Y72]